MNRGDDEKKEETMSTAEMSTAQVSTAEVLWSPDPKRVQSCGLRRYQAWLSDRHGIRTSSYLDLWKWSVAELDQFWETVWEYFDVVGERGSGPVRHGTMPGVRWFPGAQLNYAENFLRHAEERPEAEAVVGIHEDRHRETLTWRELSGQVGALAAALRKLGVQPGDRVCAVLPNIPQAIVALLATASLGAVWSVVNTDFGIRGIRDRFEQIEPKVLLTVDACHFNGSRRDQTGSLPQILDALPSVEHHILVDQYDDVPAPELRVPSLRYSQIVAEPRRPVYTRVEFNHPLWVLYSSGTTGRPKGIVHSHGGIVIEALKANEFQYDIRPGERVYFMAATTWVMWNLMVDTMSRGATVITYDGAPAHGAVDRQFEICARERVNHFGTGAAILAMMEKAGASPGTSYDLTALRSIISSGSPLPDTTWGWVYARVKDDVRLGSDSGGTDVASGFVGSNPFDPVYRGLLIGPYLGVAVDTFDSEGKPVTGELGDLVITEPMPSMPVTLWNDPDRARYRDTYFDVFPGVWRQGDWATKTPEMRFTIHGRSDATINRGGIRMGSADICQIVDQVPGVQVSMVLGAELSGGDYYMPLFVVTQKGTELDDALCEAIIRRIRSELSPRYVPDEIIQAPDVPRTRTGKMMEVPVKRVFQGADPQRVDREAAADPEVLSWYLDKARAFHLAREGRA